MADKRFYIVSKEGHEPITAESKAGAYEAWDCFGRYDVKIEYHHIWENWKNGKMIDSCYPVTRLSRRLLKSGEVNYHFSYGDALYEREVKQ